MPRLEFKSTNLAEQRDDFPKLKLEQGEKARINCPENPHVEYVHNLRMPKIGPDGAAVYTKDKNGNDKQEFDFVGRPICLGDLNALEDQGMDPKNCPACREAKKSEYVEAPVRRFAMHVIQYNTTASGAPAKPFGASTKVWSFTDHVFTKLVNMVNEYGDLDGLDIALECTNKLFQQYEMSANPVKVWKNESDKTRELVAEVYENNQAQDLASFCGRKTKREFMEGDIAKIKQRYDQLMGRSAPDLAPEIEAPSLGEGLDDLLGGSASKPAEAKPAAKNDDAEAVNFDDLFNN